MSNLERPLTAAERLIRRYRERVERGDEVIIQRISSTLEIDSSTHPTVDQITDFVKYLQEKHARRNK